MNAARLCSGLLRLCAACALVLAASGCAATLERTNRVVFGFNELVDDGLIQPAVNVYQAFTPKPVRRGVSNFFDNLTYPEVFLSAFLQGKFGQGWRDTKRFLINSTFGFGGLVDAASGFELPPHDEDFGQTLGVWGAGPGPYFVLPLLGPTTLRDVWRYPFSTLVHPLTYFGSSDVQVAGRIVGGIDERSRFDAALRARDEAALDRYLFTREAYLQKRAYLVSDGEAPIEESQASDEGLLDELEGLESP